MRFVRIVGLVLSVGFAFVGSVQASDSVESVLSRVPKSCEKKKQLVVASLKNFQQAEVKADAALKKTLQKLHVDLLRKRGRIGAARELDQIQALYHWIGTGGQLPECGLLTNIVGQYAGRLEKPRRDVIKKVVLLRKQLDKEQKQELGAELIDALADVGGVMDARNTIHPGAVLNGFRIAAGKTEGPKLKLRITHVGVDSFSGVIERDPRIVNHPVHEIKGRMNGTSFIAEIGASVSGGSKSDGKVRYTGVMVGRTIIGQFQKISPKGKRTSGGFRFDAN